VVRAEHPTPDALDEPAATARGVPPAGQTCRPSPQAPEPSATSARTPGCSVAEVSWLPARQSGNWSTSTDSTVRSDGTANAASGRVSRGSAATAAMAATAVSTQVSGDCTFAGGQLGFREGTAGGATSRPRPVFSEAVITVAATRANASDETSQRPLCRISRAGS
jgi:hypothetical protein